MSLEQIFNL